ncbi:uncharacterized protein BKA78DRAFT_300718 [Phyllosticta capitalensis]|uniref:uncharacterized protein n=1 Tax=Phyllosticta capitalensis TaxID=121624 RepID=UPI00312D10C3
MFSPQQLGLQACLLTKDSHTNIETMPLVKRRPIPSKPAPVKSSPAKNGKATAQRHRNKLVKPRPPIPQDKKPGSKGSASPKPHKDKQDDKQPEGKRLSCSSSVGVELETLRARNTKLHQENIVLKAENNVLRGQVECWKKICGVQTDGSPEKTGDKNMKP